MLKLPDIKVQASSRLYCDNSLISFYDELLKHELVSNDVSKKDYYLAFLDRYRTYFKNSLDSTNSSIHEYIESMKRNIEVMKAITDAINLDIIFNENNSNNRKHLEVILTKDIMKKIKRENLSNPSKLLENIKIAISSSRSANRHYLTAVLFYYSRLKTLYG